MLAVLRMMNRPCVYRHRRERPHRLQRPPPAGGADDDPFLEGPLDEACRKQLGEAGSRAGDVPTHAITLTVPR